MGIPVCVPHPPKRAEAFVTAAIRKNWISSLVLDEGVNFLKRLEEAFRAYVRSAHAVAVINGTAALELAVATLGIGPGDEVVLPAFTMMGSVLGVIHRGARPVFVDADPATWCIDAGRAEEAVTGRTRAIMPVHMYGYPADMDAIMGIAKRHGLRVIEDAAEAIGTRYKGRHAGSIGDIGCFSFYANKTVTSGEGGMLVTDDPELARRAAMLKDMAFSERRFIHEDIGYNYRMNNLTAAYACASFEEVEDSVARKRANAALYRQALADIEGVTLPPPDSAEAVNSYWMFGILIDPERFGRTKDEVREMLAARFGVETRDFFYPLHKQPAIVRRGLAEEGLSLPVSEMLWDRGMYLPSGIDLTEGQIAAVADALKAVRK